MYNLVYTRNYKYAPPFHNENCSSLSLLPSPSPSLRTFLSPSPPPSLLLSLLLPLLPSLPLSIHYSTLLVFLFTHPLLLFRVHLFHVDLSQGIVLAHSMEVVEDHSPVALIVAT